MHLHEFQAKQLLRGHGVVIPPFAVISRREELDEALKLVGPAPWVLKIQVHAGGRGKAGGVKVAKNPQEAATLVEGLLGMHLVNAQTGPEGVLTRKVLITSKIRYEKEYYIAFTVDRARAEAILLASPEGGMEIEQIAEEYPERLLRYPLPLDGRLRGYQLWEIAKFMGWRAKVAEAGRHLIYQLARVFVDLDAWLLEVNPLVSTEEGQLIVLDAKLSIDDNALFRHPKLAALFDATQLPEREAEAQQQGLAYVALEGTIGCMVNGAGLAMATMDLIQQYGGRPANFLDVGGSATKEKIAQAFKMVVKDPHVEAILINIFGGIMNCQTLAEGVVSAARELKIQVPIVIRMEGTYVEEGKKCFQESALPIEIVSSLDEAARRVVCRS